MTDGTFREGIHLTCAFCATAIAAPAYSELKATGGTVMVWHCPSCASVFETSETAPSESEVTDAIEAYWPNLLVA